MCVFGAIKSNGNASGGEDWLLQIDMNNTVDHLAGGDGQHIVLKLDMDITTIKRF